MLVLLDTNVVSELRKGRRCHKAVAAWQSGIDLQALFLSVVTLLELRLGIALKARKDRAAGDVLLDWYEKVVKPTFAGRILAVDERIAERCALLHVPVTKPWRDSLIAATAAEHGLIVATRNVADFKTLGSRWSIRGPLVGGRCRHGDAGRPRPEADRTSGVPQHPRTGRIDGARSTNQVSAFTAR